MLAKISYNAFELPLALINICAQGLGYGKLNAKLQKAFTTENCKTSLIRLGNNAFYNLIDYGRTKPIILGGYPRVT